MASKKKTSPFFSNRTLPTTRGQPMIKRNKPSPSSDQYSSPSIVVVVEAEEEEEALLPGLPNHLSQLCLTLLPPPLLFSVCRSWRRLLYSPSCPPFFSLYALLSSQNTNTNTNSSIDLFSLGPLSSTCRPLPPQPREPPLQILHSHPSFLSRMFPIQSLTVSNHLVLIAGTTPLFSPSLSKPLVFHPETSRWFFGPPYTTPRRWCATGSVGGTVFLASGVGARYCREVARSMEQWDLTKRRETWKWDKLAGLKHGRFSREAVEGIGYKGKLFMVNVKGNAVKEGVVYNPEGNSWEEIPMGMLAGWKGPASAMDEEVMYVVDEARGVLSEYNGERDRWEELVEMPELRQAEQIAAGRGRVCAVVGSGERVIVVDVCVRPARVWVVEPPCGRQVVGVHILPRMRNGVQGEGNCA